MVDLSPIASGSQIEALVIAKIYGEGGRASIPFDHGMGYDLISDFSGALNRVEVKRAYAGFSRGRINQGSPRLEVDLRARSGTSATRLPSPTTSDIFIIEAAGHFYILPTHIIEGRQSIVLRPPGYEAIKSVGVHPVVNFNEFREAWNLLNKEV